MQYIKQYNFWKNHIFEQAAPVNPEKKYGSYELGTAFADNYTEPEPNIYQPIIKQMISDFKKATEVERYEKDASKFKMKVISSASSRSATNRYEKETPPNHDYGGVLKKYSPKGWIKATPETEKDKRSIPEGNAFLAKARGEATKNLILVELNAAGIKILAQNIEVVHTVSALPDKREQFVRVEIEGLLVKEPVPEPDKFIIIYPWFKLGDSNKPYAYLANQLGGNWDKNLRYQLFQEASELKAVPQKSFVSAVENSSDLIKAAGYHKSDKSSRAHQMAFVPISGWASATGDTFVYDSEEKWLQEVKKLEEISNFIDKNKVYEKGVKGRVTFQVKPNLEHFKSLTLLKPFNMKDQVVSVTQEKAGTAPESHEQSKASIK